MSSWAENRFSADVSLHLLGTGWQPYSLIAAQERREGTIFSIFSSYSHHDWLVEPYGVAVVQSS